MAGKRCRVLGPAGAGDLGPQLNSFRSSIGREAFTEHIPALLDGDVFVTGGNNRHISGRLAFVSLGARAEDVWAQVVSRDFAVRHFLNGYDSSCWDTTAFPVTYSHCTDTKRLSKRFLRTKKIKCFFYRFHAGKYKQFCLPCQLMIVYFIDKQMRLFFGDG